MRWSSSTTRISAVPSTVRCGARSPTAVRSARASSALYVARTAFDPFVAQLVRGRARAADRPRRRPGRRARAADQRGGAGQGGGPRRGRGRRRRRGGRRRAAPGRSAYRAGSTSRPCSSEVPRDRPIAREEIFGPVVTVEPFDGDDDAVALANAGAFGLGASVWSRDPARARRRRVPPRGRLGVDRTTRRTRTGSAGRRGAASRAPASAAATVAPDCSSACGSGTSDEDRGRLPARRGGTRTTREASSRSERCCGRSTAAGAGLPGVAAPGARRARAAGPEAMSELSHVDDRGRRADGRRGREAALPAPRHGPRDGAHGGRDRAPPARAAEGRRAGDGAARRDHGSEADERPDPALPSAAALARHGRRSRSARPRSRSSRSRRRPRRRASRWRRSRRRRSPR